MEPMERGIRKEGTNREGIRVEQTWKKGTRNHTGTQTDFKKRL